MKANGITIYSINGNHDLSNDRLDSIDNSSLGLLYLLDIIKPFSLIETPHFTITGVPFPDEVPVRISEKYSICVSHRFYNMSESNSLNKDSVKELGYNMYCLGHDHAVYDLTDVDGIKVVRPGSFMRGTSHYYNTSRLVYTDIIDYPVSVTRVTLPVKEPDQVFSATVLEKKSLQTVTQDFSELISKLYDNNVQDEDIYQILEQNVININIKKQIIQYLEQSGIYKEEKDGRTES